MATDNIDQANMLPKEVEPIAKRGEIYLLGGTHRVMCGDATNETDVAALMGGAKADMVFTDPPYGVKRDKGFSGFCGFGGQGEPIARRRYEDGDWDSQRPEKKTFDLILGMAETALIFGGNFFADMLPPGNHWVVWDKKNTMPTFGDAELIWTNIKRNSVKIIECEYNGLLGKEQARFHPTQKPVKLLSAILKTYSQEGTVIFDPFLGSGSTLIACEQTGRACYGMEIEPHYVDVIIQRFKDFTCFFNTGKEVEKV